MNNASVKTSRRTGVDMATQILDVAEVLVQTRGFNAFSYADVAHELGCTKAALHYHFASKSELGEALITRYTERFLQALVVIEAASDDGPTRLNAYADLYFGVLRQRRMCLCGILTAEYATLPDPMQQVVRHFFDTNETWLESVLRQGKETDSLSFEQSPRETARVIVSSLEGAMLVAWPFNDLERFRSAADHLMNGLTT
jgi:TetR/AcrR family transcriptional regulator, transcriptional repressor for nem operon